MGCSAISQRRYTGIRRIRAARYTNMRLSAPSMDSLRLDIAITGGTTTADTTLAGPIRTGMKTTRVPEEKTMVCPSCLTIYTVTPRRDQEWHVRSEGMQSINIKDTPQIQAASGPLCVDSECLAWLVSLGEAFWC